MKLIPFIYFSGNAEEALNFYKEVFNGQITVLTRFADTPMPVEASDKNKLIHGRLVFGDNVILISDDLRNDTKPAAETRQLFVEIRSTEKLKHLFERLCKDGKVIIPLALQFWGALFGSVEDKYGIVWRLNCEVEKG